MMRLAALSGILVAAFTAGAAAKDPGDGAYMIRMLACEGEDAKMELYVPQSIAFGATPPAKALAQPVIGYYALDLGGANKGKSLEPVKVSMTADGKTIIVNQYTRGLPPTRIPVGGGTVDFDQRFGTGAKCGPFQAQDPNFGG
ncbi:MAG: hypothetical protein ACLP19_00170 [Xanthobacteraceae bacterium]